jgi:L-lactate dehydrogenase (cytochrome)
MSICSIEDVAEAADKPFWFQLYVIRDRDFNDRLIGRAKAAGCSALVLTLDLQILAQRNKDIRNGLTAPPRMTLANIADIAMKPRWWRGMLRTPRRTFRNIVGHAPGVKDTRALASWTNEQFDPTLNWDDVKRIKERWGGKLILKGILDPEDAELAVKSGADALIVSNHGGRQLDGVPGSIRSLPEVAAAVGNSIEVLVDGGIRNGGDVIKALSLGARAVLVGRAYAYGLAAAGEPGVARAIEILRTGMIRNMKLLGVTSIRQLDRSYVDVPSGWLPRD